MGGNGWDSDDVWDLNGIHVLTAGATLAQKDNEMECHAGAQANLPVAVNWNPIPTQNRFSVFQETPSDSNLQNQFLRCVSQFECWVKELMRHGGVCRVRSFLERTS